MRIQKHMHTFNVQACTCFNFNGYSLLINLDEIIDFSVTSLYEITTS